MLADPLSTAQYASLHGKEYSPGPTPSWAALRKGCAEVIGATNNVDYGVSIHACPYAAWSSRLPTLQAGQGYIPAGQLWSIAMSDHEQDLDIFASFWLEEPLPDVLDILQNAESEPDTQIPANSEPDQEHDAPQRPKRGASKHKAFAELDCNGGLVRTITRMPSRPRSGGRSEACPAVYLPIIMPLSPIKRGD